MRVAMYYSNHDVRVEEMPVPEIGPEELLVKVEASGICGSDVMEWYRIQRAPMVLGHEVAGTIVKAGSGVDRFKARRSIFKVKFVLSWSNIVCSAMVLTVRHASLICGLI